MKRKYHFPIFVLTLFSIIGAVNAQNKVRINANTQRFIGEVSTLDRTKFFSVHDRSGDADAMAFRAEYNVTGGRGFYGPFSYGRQQTGEVAVYPAGRAGDDALRDVTRYVATEHPYNTFVDGMDPVLAADWAVEYYKDFVDQSGRPEYFEPMNEPFVHTKDFYPGNWNADENERIRQQMITLYNEIGAKINASPALENMKMVGYSSAFPSMEINDFGHWEDNQKAFMDGAGANMFAFSTHLYDGINITGQDSKRSGSNSEAILDLIENYSFVKWGRVKPHAITEYGAIESGYGPDYSEIASAQTMRSINHILFNLLEREDRIAISIPFVTGKALWHITEANNYQPYTPALWIPTNIGEANPEGFRYSPRIHFYDLWKDVQGNRVFIKSDNPDIQVHAFVDNEKLFVALNNLDEADQVVDLDFISGNTGLNDVVVKSLKIFAQAMPDYTIETVTQAPETVTLIAYETVILQYNFDNPITFENALRTKTYFSEKHLQPILANTAQQYTFNGVATGDGFATLRMSIGRKHNVSKKPILTVNGTSVDVPNNWKGYDQANRDDFFGMIEIPFSAVLLNTENEINLTFPDAGGTVSSLILSVDTFDLARNALSVSSLSSTCPDAANGKIVIETLIAGDYEVTIVGQEVNETLSFSNTFGIEDLAAGTYDLVVTSTTDIDFEQQYSMEITEPEPLSVTSKIDPGTDKLNLSLSGGELYKITLNGIGYATDQDTIELPLRTGENSLYVETEKDCQGVYEEKLILNSNLMVAPNPFSNRITITIPQVFHAEELTYTIYALTGKALISETMTDAGTSLGVATENLPSGMYVLQVTSVGKITYQTKIVKK